MPAKAHALLEEDVRALTLRLALPGLLAMTATGAGTLLDALMLSRMGGAQTAAAAVGFPLLTLFQTIGFTLGMGAGCTVSQAIGRGDEDTPRRSAALALLLALAVSLPLSALGLAFIRPLVRLLGAPPALETEAVRYARALLLCGPPLCASLVLGSLLRARGRLRSYAAAHALGAALGAAMEALLVLRMGLGIGAVGAAMLAREGLTLLLLARAMRGALPGTPVRLFSKKQNSGQQPLPLLTRSAPSAPFPARLTAAQSPTAQSSSRRLLPLLAELTRYGLPTLLRQGLMSVSSALLSRTAAAFGEAALGGMGLAVRALALISSAIIGFGQGFQPVCGANAGAG
ncbi:MAG: MATE family efflux transporter, partial [Clostridiales bacterium]|nr:MATE family efflux transporter [Clostridiales bacterium]